MKWLTGVLGSDNRPVLLSKAFVDRLESMDGRFSEGRRGVVQAKLIHFTYRRILISSHS